MLNIDWHTVLQQLDTRSKNVVWKLKLFLILPVTLASIYFGYPNVY